MSKITDMFPEANLPELKKPEKPQWPIPDVSRIELGTCKATELIVKLWPVDDTYLPGGTITKAESEKRPEYGHGWIVKIGKEASELTGMDFQIGDTVEYPLYSMNAMPYPLDKEYIHINAKDILRHITQEEARNAPQTNTES